MSCDAKLPISNGSATAKVSRVEFVCFGFIDRRMPLSEERCRQIA